MAAPPKPTNVQILTWLHQMRAGWDNLYRRTDSETDLYFQTFRLTAPEGYRTVRLGTAPADIDQAVETLMPSAVIGVHVPPAKDTQEWQELADRRGKWLRALLQRWREHQDIVHQLLWAELVQNVRFAFVGYDPLPPHLEDPPSEIRGESAESYRVRLEAWANERENHLPVTFELKPEGTVYCQEQNGRIVRLWEAYSREVADLHYWYPPSKFPSVKLATQGYDPMQRVSFIAYWDENWRAAYVDYNPIFSSRGGNDETRGVVPNPYGCLPFVRFYFKKLPVNSVDRSYRGFLSNAREMYETESQIASQGLAILSRAAWPVVLTRFIDNRKFVQTPGSSFPLRPGESVDVFAGAAPLPEVGQMWDRIRATIRQNALGASAGQMPAGIRSASALSMVSGVDRNKVMPALRECERGLAEALTIAEKIVENLHGEPVTLPYGKTGTGNSLAQVSVGPSDIRRYYAKEIDFGPDYGPDVVQRAAALDTLTQHKFMPRSKAWELLPEWCESVTDWNNLLIQEASDGHPLMTQAHVMQRLYQFAPRMFEYLYEMGAFDQGGGPGGPGGAPGPGSGPTDTGSAPAPPTGPETHNLMAPTGAQHGAPGSQIGVPLPGISPVRGGGPTAGRRMPG